MLLFYKIWKNCNEIQLTKNKMDMKNLKMKNNPPIPDCTIESFNLISSILFAKFGLKDFVH